MATQPTPNQPMDKSGNKQSPKEQRQFNQNDGGKSSTDVSDRDRNRNNDKGSDRDDRNQKQ